MGEKKNIIMNLVELGKRNQKVTTKEINDALEEIGFEGSLSLETHIPNSVPDGAEREAAENKLFLDAKRLARR